MGINKAEDDGRKDAHIWFAKALCGFFLRRWAAISHFVAGSARRRCATEVQDHLICGNAGLDRLDWHGGGLPPGDWLRW